MFSVKEIATLSLFHKCENWGYIVTQLKSGKTGIQTQATWLKHTKVWPKLKNTCSKENNDSGGIFIKSYPTQYPWNCMVCISLLYFTSSSVAEIGSSPGLMPLGGWSHTVDLTGRLELWSEGDFWPVYTPGDISVLSRTPCLPLVSSFPLLPPVNSKLLYFPLLQKAVEYFSHLKQAKRIKNFFFSFGCFGSSLFRTGFL